MDVRAAQEVDFMVKRLEHKEKQQSRALWEEIFADDSREFLDYYYTEKVQDNLIIGDFSENTLVSMLHLNPYQLYMDEQEILSYYIVAVATKEKYRHQGRMARILKEALLIAGMQEIPFVFLMPAKEAIYRPFGFVTVYGRKDYLLAAESFVKKADSTIYIEEIADCGKRDIIAELIKYSQTKLSQQYQVYAKRDEAYYIRLIKEQKSQQGSILLARDSVSDVICGYCFSALEDTVQLRELVCDDGKEMEILCEIWKQYGQNKEMKLLGAELSEALQVETIFPCIMIRITDICRFTELIPLKKEEIQWIKKHPVIEILDSFLQENQGQYIIDVEERNNKFFAKMQKQHENSQNVLKFTIEEIQIKSFEKLKIFLNEVV